MILVDSSVWVDFLHARDTRQTSFLKGILGSEQIVTADLVLMEVLQGCRDEQAAAIAEEELLACDLLIVGGEHVAREAARLYRVLRSKGITVRRTIDTLIATRCIVEEIDLLYSDRDFHPFVQHFGLRPALEPLGMN